MNGGYVTRLSTWAKQPFSTQMDLYGWALFTIALISIAFLWTRVLRHVVND